MQPIVITRENVYVNICMYKIYTVLRSILFVSFEIEDFVGTYIYEVRMRLRRQRRNHIFHQVKTGGCKLLRSPLFLSSANGRGMQPIIIARDLQG